MEHRLYAEHGDQVIGSGSIEDIDQPLKMPQQSGHGFLSLRRSENSRAAVDQAAKRSSQASDSSSAYSGSDAVPLSADDMDADNLGGLDSDNEEGPSYESHGSLIVRDKVREYLERDPAHRSEDDIEVLLEFMQHMPAFSNMTLSMRRELCAVMVFAVVEKAHTIVLNDGEQLDTWSVILNGHVEVAKPDGTIEHLHMGDSFGVAPTLENQYHSGIMRTKVDDCQFVCIAQHAYHQIFHKGEESMVRLEENGEVVLVMEKKKLEGGRMGQIILRATPEKLMTHLIEENEADRTYVEDFLLTCRTFLKSPMDLTNRLISWFYDPNLREKVVKIVLLWTSNHFLDFETEAGLYEFLEKFEVLLEGHKLTLHVQALHSIYSTKSSLRSVVLTRASRDDPLSFCIAGGVEKASGVYISKIERGSKASEAGLKRGDQIIEVNNCSFEHISCERAGEILRSSTHLVLTVKSNLPFSQKVPQSPDMSPRHTRFSQGSSEQRSKSGARDGDSRPASLTSSPSKCLQGRQRDRCSSPAQPSKIRKAFLKLSLLQREDSSDLHFSHELSSSHPCSRKSSSMSDNSGLCHPLSNSDPDLVSSSRALDRRGDIPEHVIRVYRSDQSFKYLPIHKETTAREVVMLALAEFGNPDPSGGNYSLCEVTFEECGTRTKHLPDQLNNLADRCRLNSRYYLKNNKSIEMLVPDDLTDGILRESQVALLQLVPAEVAIQLTLRDFHLFQNIEPAEYINDLFEIESKTDSPNLCQFSELVNQEMFWVVSEVCAEPNLVKRTKIIKHFIKIAKYCRLARNFNSLFAILSGLGHGSVSRLRQTWDKISTKYIKLFEEMQGIMDPSRNMSKYRNLLSSHLAHPPVIPFFPLVKKDLTFIHFGNDSRVDGLVNFDKLRMIAKEIHQVHRLASCPTYGRKAWPYENILPDFSSLSGSMHGTMRHKKTTVSSILNPKKMYDEALMARKVRTYLMNLKVLDDELKLAQMSSACEPPGRISMKKTDQSVSVSSSSSDISATPLTTPFFGSSSPTAIRKLLSLSDKCRPIDQKKCPVASYRQALPANSPSTSRSPAFRQKKQNPLLTAVSLSSDSSSVIGVKQPTNTTTTNHHLNNHYEAVSIENVSRRSMTIDIRNHLDSDSGHSSVASSVGDNLSPVNSTHDNSPVAVPGDLVYLPETVTASPSVTYPVLTYVSTAREYNKSHHQWPPNYPLALKVLDEQKRRLRWHDHRRQRTVSYHESAQYHDIPNIDRWDVSEYDDLSNGEVELVSIV